MCFFLFFFFRTKSRQQNQKNGTFVRVLTARQKNKLVKRSWGKKNLKKLFKMYCSNEECVAKTMFESHLCIDCFEQKWGPNPLCNVPLPMCLLQIVATFFSIKDYGKYWQLLSYFGLRFCLLPTISDAVLFETKQNCTDNLFWSFIVDRYARSQTLWSYLKNPYDYLLPNHLDAAKVLVSFYPLRLTFALYLQSKLYKTDDVLWWILDTKCAVVWNDFYELVVKQHRIKWRHLLRHITQWKSDRLLQLLIDRGCFENEYETRIVLENFTNDNDWQLLPKIWALHYGNEFCNWKHDRILFKALHDNHIQTLVFFCSLKGFCIPSLYQKLLIRRLNHNETTRAFLIENNPVIDFDQKPCHLYQMRWRVFLQLLLHGAFHCVNSETLTDICLTHNILIKLLVESRINELLQLLPTITHLGSFIDQFARVVCCKMSLGQLCQLLQFPVMQKHITFAVLRNACPTFVSKMFAHNPSLQHLEWLMTWRDFDQQTLTLADAHAKNNALMRFAVYCDMSYKHNGETKKLDIWITEIIQKYILK